ncbi:SpoIID/LytB domain-containing protein [Vallitalea sp.]|jgi:stage II sporulation protein D|uniref:SpoIID/LytB domain-containing protein n=1 Tax=Vallitalea sp. TaxID=1882829 RepID=UPI0025E179A2|nr:SpoIID/LytB domain-containing protein [Vallitalea sp.]MCT4686794.1 SpoIID/LytB domain-containing protein [Vallitalea sp.]
MKYSKIIGVTLLIIIMLCACTTTKDTIQDNSIRSNNQAVNNIDNDLVNPKGDNVEKISEPPVAIKSDMIVTRAVAAKMISLANFDKRTIEISDREIEFQDTTPENWFDKYINMVVINKWMLGGSKTFNPLRPLTISELLTIGERLDIDLDNLKIDLTNKDEAVSYKDFMSFYKVLCEKNKDEGGIRVKKLTVFATPANSVSLNSWQMATNYGMYTFEGLTLDRYLDKEIEVIIRDREIVAVKRVINETPKLTNAYIEKIDGNIATVFMGGISRELTINHDKYKQKNDVIGDIIIDNGHITGILLKEQKVAGKVLLMSSDKVSLDEFRTYFLTDDAKIYSTVNGIRWKSINNIIVGYDSADFVVDDNGLVCAAVIRDKVDINNIRVLISTNKFRSKYHKNVSITATTDYIIEYGNNKKQTKAGDIISINDNYFESCDRIYVKSLDNGKITINSIKRGNNYNPSYRGIIEIAKEKEGYLIVNEVPVEEYLYAVVPSEMPTSYGIEASKTQAVCARSYAYTQFYSNRYCKYGAHVIDSVSSQVYNNAPENETSIRAVNETSKMGLTYNGNVVSANFFSTSCGFTASSGEVWPHYSNREFPTTSPKYLRAKPQFDGETKYDNLEDGELFREFILDDKIDSYDKKFAYYRWSVELTKEHIESCINNTIGKQYKKQPKLIKTLDENKIFRSRPIDSIGTLKDIGIYKRGKGGNITEMIIEGSEGIVKVSTEYNIRLLVSPISYIEGKETVPVILQNKSEKIVDKLMPSAFYIIDKEYDKDGNLIKILFRGGGYGHGVGMSQNGVKGMVDKGYDFNKILNHYYEGTKIKEIY